MRDTPSTPLDQAHGLRQMFVQHALRFIPVAANPFVAFGGVLLERLCTALSQMQLHTLVVDAADTAGTPHELARFDLSEGIEHLAPDVSYVCARGLPLLHVDSRGSTAGFLDTVAASAGTAQVVIVHASATELCRLFGHRSPDALPPHPLVLCDERTESLTHAYADAKLLATRAELRVHDAMLASPPQRRQAAQIALRLARCAETFVGAIQHRWAAIDPIESASAPPMPELLALAQDLYETAHRHTLTDSVFCALQHSALTLQPSPALIPTT